MHPFLDRLKQRKIVQWALAYLAGAGVLYSTLDGPLRIWGVTDGQLKIVQVLLVVGFFLALTLAWYHGERGDQKVSGVELLILAGIMGLGAIGIRLVGYAPVPDSHGDRAPFRVELPAAEENHRSLRWAHVRPNGIFYDASDGRVWFRSWDQAEVIPVGPESANNFNPSPDGSVLTWRRGGAVYAADVPVGETRTLYEGRNIAAQTVGADGWVYFTAQDSAIHRVHLSGDRGVERVSDPDSGEMHFELYSSAHGRYGLFNATTQDQELLYGVDLRSGEQRVLGLGRNAMMTTSGHVLWADGEGGLMASRFDPRSLSLEGTPVRVTAAIAHARADDAR